MASLVGEPVVIGIKRGEKIEADLHVPVRSSGLVTFVHESGSNRFNSRNRDVAESLRARGLGTLLLDLLTRGEEELDLQTQEHRFDIDRLARRVVVATDWMQTRSDVSMLPIGYFGASTGAAAALVAAAARPSAVRAIVSRGGRPDVPGAVLSRLTVPTLLIVGGRDKPVIELNAEAKAQMQGADVELAIVPNATHLFEEPGTLERVAQLAGDWFVRHLRAT